MGSITTSKPKCRCVVCVLAVTVLAMAAPLASGDETTELNAQLTTAKAALAKAQAEERDFVLARGSLDMARAATEAIAEQAELEKLVAERTVRNKDYREQLANDQGVANRALTGYGVDAQSGQFRYIGTSHDDTAKTVFGKKDSSPELVGQRM